MMLLHVARSTVLVVLGKPLLGACLVMNPARAAAEGDMVLYEKNPPRQMPPAKPMPP